MRLFTKRFRENIIVTLAIASFTSLCLASGVASLLDARFSDLLFLPRAPHPDIAIIAIDDKSIQAIGRWPWDRREHAKLLDTLFEVGVKAVGYDVNFPEASTRADDAALAAAISGKPVVLPVELTMERKDDGWRGMSPLPPINALAEATLIAGGIGFANVPRDGDGIAREVPLSVPVDGKMYAAFASRVLAVIPAPDRSPGQALAGIHLDENGSPTKSGMTTRKPEDDNSTVRINFSGPPGTFPRYSFIDVIEGRVPNEKLKGKILLVGATAADLHDDLIVPTSGGLPMPGVEVHANILETLIRGNSLRALPKSYGVALVFLYALIVGVILTRTKLRYGTLAAITVALIHMIAALVMFENQIVLPMVWPIMSIVATFVAIVAIRYFHEQRERQKLRTTLNQYLSPVVVADLLANPDKIKLGGERRAMTVLFSDLRGFTTLSEGLKPEELVTILNHYLDVMTEKVFETNGVVDKYMGDAIMAFWGASFLDSDHADRAVLAAIQMRETLNQMNSTKAWPRGVELNLGIGLNTGDMVVGNMGSSKRFDYTVMGDAVNLGSRLEGLNKEYGTQIIASEFARRATTPGRFAFRALDLVAVKGKKEPVEIFEVVGEANADIPAKAGTQSFEQAIALYRAQKFAEAKKLFEELAKTGDYASRMYIERCKSFIEHPPAPDWNGVWVYTKK